MTFKEFLVVEEGLIPEFMKSSLFKAVGTVLTMVSLPLSANAKETLIDQLTKHEGIRYTAYSDTVGKKTIGIGFNLDSNQKLAKQLFTKWKLDFDAVYNGTVKLTDEQVKELFKHSLAFAISVAESYIEDFDKQPDAVKEVVINMAFNLGNKLHDFKKTKQFIETKQYKKAAKEMLNSKWAKQVKDRAKELSDKMASI